MEGGCRGPDDDTVVLVEDLHLTYPGSGEPALRGLSFSVRKGEIFGLLGPNGAGKTSTVSVLSTLLRPTSGRAEVCGLDVRRRGREVRRRVGVVPQDIALYPLLTAEENLGFFGRLFGMDRGRLRRRIGETLELVGLSERARRRVSTFSGGMKRRLNLAAGLLHEPELLFLDEPTVGVDPQSRRFLFENVRRLGDRGLTVLYTTHYMEEAEALCDRVAVVDAGRVAALGSPAELLEDHGGDAVTVALSERPPEGLLAAVESRPGVRSIRFDGHKLHVGASAAQEMVSGLLEDLRSAGLAPGPISIKPATLEEVFLSLTGRSLRDR